MGKIRFYWNKDEWRKKVKENDENRDNNIEIDFLVPIKSNKNNYIINNNENKNQENNLIKEIEFTLISSKIQKKIILK